MTAFTAAAGLAYATSCQIAAFGHVLVAPELIQAQAGVESGFDPQSIGPRNKDGTFDYGLMGINEANLAPLGLTRQTAMDPCNSIAASVRVLLSRYNTGKPVAGIQNGYVGKVLARVPLDASAPQMTIKSPRSEEPLHDAVHVHPTTPKEPS
jgi:hypothetical protein